MDELEIMKTILVFMAGISFGAYIACDYLDREDEEDESME